MPPRNDLDPDNNRWHWLASDLRIWRLERNMTQPALGEILGVTKTQVSNWESARENIPMKHAETLDQVWKTNGHFVRLRVLAESDHDPNWFDQFTRYEHRAILISPYAALSVPALLQTPDYARALITSGQMVDDIDAGVEERMARQDALDRPDPPALWVLIKESVLWDPIGSVEIMRGQLAHLIDMSHRRDLVVRVVPRNIGAHPGVDGAFTLLQTGGREVAWSEAVGGGRLVTDPAKVREYRRRFDLIGADALSRDSTRSLIAEIMEAMH